MGVALGNPKGRSLNLKSGSPYSKIETCLVSRNASSPSLPNSRPQPLCFKPPKGNWLVAGARTGDRLRDLGPADGAYLADLPAVRRIVHA